MVVLREEGVGGVVVPRGLWAGDVDGYRRMRQSGEGSASTVGGVGNW